MSDWEQEWDELQAAYQSIRYDGQLAEQVSPATSATAKPARRYWFPVLVTCGTVAAAAVMMMIGSPQPHPEIADAGPSPHEVAVGGPTEVTPLDVAGRPGQDRRDVTATGPDVARPVMHNTGPSASLLTLPLTTDSSFGTNPSPPGTSPSAAVRRTRAALSLPAFAFDRRSSTVRPSRRTILPVLSLASRSKPRPDRRAGQSRVRRPSSFIREKVFTRLSSHRKPLNPLRRSSNAT